MRMKRASRSMVVFVTVLFLVLTAACTPREVELLEGILQDVDAVNGEVTIVTKDGKTVTVTIDTDAPIETEGASSALETLEPGVSVEVEVNDDGQVAHRIKARQAKTKGTIVEVIGDNVTIESERGNRVTVRVTDQTRIELEDNFPGTLADLQVGVEVEIKFDPESRVAFKIDTEEEEAEIEGVIVGIEGDEVTIETERGHRRTLVITDTTRIELDEDFPGMVTDLQVGIEVEAKFDPFTRLAFKIEIEKADEDEETSKLTPVPGVGWGIIEIRVTDPPPADVKSAVVYLTNIEVHKVSDNASGWIPIPMSGNVSSFDLLDVIGVEQLLGSANITAGKFTQIRMDVIEVVGETTDNVSYTAEVPGEKLKIVRPFNIGGGTTTVLTLDFDGEKSLIRTGSGKFLFKPVVKLLIAEKGKAEKDEEEEKEEKEDKDKDKDKGKPEAGEAKEMEFEGTIDAIDGNIWTMTIEGETRTIDVSEAEIEGEPAAGPQAKVKGAVVDDTIKASEVEIKEVEEGEA